MRRAQHHQVLWSVVRLHFVDVVTVQVVRRLAHYTTLVALQYNLAHQVEQQAVGTAVLVVRVPLPNHAGRVRRIGASRPAVDRVRRRWLKLRGAHRASLWLQTHLRRLARLAAVLRSLRTWHRLVACPASPGVLHCVVRLAARQAAVHILVSASLHLPVLVARPLKGLRAQHAHQVDQHLGSRHTDPPP